MTVLRIRVLDVPVSELGEGPLWRADEHALYWIDIRAAVLHRWSDRDGYGGAIALPAAPGCVVDGPGETILVATAAGLVLVDPATRAVIPYADPPREGGRFNDGAVDPGGRLWIGTVESAPGAADGVLLRIEPSLDVTVVRRGLAVPNGIGFGPDARTMYFTETEGSRVLAFDYDPDTGEATRERTFLADDGCSPDGLVVDRDGGVWSAKWAGSRVTRTAPDGSVLGELAVPVTNVTSVAFGGEGLRTLFVTTAVDEPGGRVSPLPEAAGRVLAIDGLDAAGWALPAFAGSARRR